MHEVIIKRQAKKRLQKLLAVTRAQIVEQIYFLGQNPDDVRLDIKKMQGKSGFRLRIGQWRVIFERDDEVKIISIEKIGSRGDIYK